MVFTFGWTTMSQNLVKKETSVQFNTTPENPQNITRVSQFPEVGALR